MFIVTKGNDKVSVADHESAKNLVYSLNDVNCPEPIKKQEIIGVDANTRVEDLFKVSFLDREVNVVGQANAESILSWMLTLGCDIISIERIKKSE